MGQNDLFTISDSMIEKVMKACGIENTTVIFKGTDYFVSIMKIEESAFSLKIDKLEKPIKKEDILQLVLTFNGKRFLLSLMVSTLKMADGNLIIETQIVGKTNLEVRSKLDELLESLRFLDNRKFNRLFMDEETLQNFNIIPRMKVEFIRKEYVAYIKDISAGGIAFLSVKDLLNERAEIYTLKVNFSNPSENMVLKGEILRKNVVNIDGTEFVEIAMKLHDNIYLNKRIIDYFKKTGKLNAALSVG